MTNKKTIQINKDLFSLSNRMAKKKEKKIKTQKIKSGVSATKMKKEFYKKVKDFQQQREKKLQKKPNKEEKEFEDEFNKSLGFLQNIISSKNSSKPTPVKLGVPKTFSVLPQLNSSNSTLKLPPAPPYSSLKNSTKPTYRQWVKSSKNLINKQPDKLVIEKHEEDKDTKDEELSERALKLEKFKNENKISNLKNKDVILKNKITKTYKHKLGKCGGIVSVLIKNRETKRNVQIEKAKLAQKSIHDIKRYLKKKNFIKSGSQTPNDVLRCMFEQCLLAGDLENKNSENLIHNFVNS